VQEESLMTLVDVHCHLDAQAYDDPETVCRQSRQAGVAVVVAAGTGAASNRRVLGLRRQYSGQVWAALGFHPERPEAAWEECEAVVAQIEAHRANVVALGEVGLPHYALREGRMSPAQAQRHEAFLDALVQQAVRLDLPVVLHAPHEAAARALDIVKRHQPPGAVFHWHKSTPEVTAAICEAGYFVSVTPEVCYRERDRALVRTVALEHLLLESDGPWPYGGEFAGRLTTPAVVVRVACEVARLKGVSPREVQEHTTANATRLFGRQAGGEAAGRTIQS
jgi:TatD DNase family protein